MINDIYRVICQYKYCLEDSRAIWGGKGSYLLFNQRSNRMDDIE